MRQTLCDPEFAGTSFLVSIQNLSNVHLLDDTAASLMIPMLQPPAKDALELAVRGADAPIRIRQCFNTLVDAYALWQWSHARKCGPMVSVSSPALGILSRM